MPCQGPPKPPKLPGSGGGGPGPKGPRLPDFGGGGPGPKGPKLPDFGGGRGRGPKLPDYGGGPGPKLPDLGGGPGPERTEAARPRWWRWPGSQGAAAARTGRRSTCLRPWADLRRESVSMCLERFGFPRTFAPISGLHVPGLGRLNPDAHINFRWPGGPPARLRGDFKVNLPWLVRPRGDFDLNFRWPWPGRVPADFRGASTGGCRLATYASTSGWVTSSISVPTGVSCAFGWAPPPWHGGFPPWGLGLAPWGWGPPPPPAWAGWIPPPWGPAPAPFDYWGFTVIPVWDPYFQQWGFWEFGIWVPLPGQ